MEVSKGSGVYLLFRVWGFTSGEGFEAPQTLHRFSLLTALLHFCAGCMIGSALACCMLGICVGALSPINPNP